MWAREKNPTLPAPAAGLGAGVCWKEAEGEEGSDTSSSASHMKKSLLSPPWQQSFCFPFLDTSCSPAQLPVWEGGALLLGSWQCEDLGLVPLHPMAGMHHLCACQDRDHTPVPGVVSSLDEPALPKIKGAPQLLQGEANLLTQPVPPTVSWGTRNETAHKGTAWV